MIVVLFKKRRGVNVKANFKLLSKIYFILIIVLGAYLLSVKISSSVINSNEKLKSTANYIEIKENNEILMNTEEDIAVYEGMTLDELSDLLNKSLPYNLEGKGYLIASLALEHNVDPIMATAIMLHETGCKWGCSRLVYECNNVGGQKGSGCGSYAYFNTLDEGITAFIKNLEVNYINFGLTTPEMINPKYAEDTNWSSNVNKYIEIIKAQ